MVDFTNKEVRQDIDELYNSLRKKAQDGTISVAEEDMLNKVRTNYSLGKKFSQGPTLGGSDEISSFATSLLPDKNRDAIIKYLTQKNPEKNLSSYDVDLANYRRDLLDTRGILASGTEMGGAVLPYILGGKSKLLKKFLRPKTWKGTAGAGAADAGIYGFLTGEGWQDRVEKSGLYAGSGGVLSSAFKGIGNLGGKAYRWMNPPGKEQAVNDARKLIAETLEIEGLTVKDAVAKILAGKNSKITLADLGDTNTLTNFLQAVRELDGPAFASAVKILKDREKGKPKRLYHLFSGGSKEGRAIDSLMFLKAARKKEASPHYRNAFYYINNKTGARGGLKTMPIGEELNQLFLTPNFKHAFNHAKNLALEKRKTFPYKLVDGAIIDAKTGKKINNIPTLYLHYMKKGYDDFLSSMYKKTDVGTLQTQAITENKNILVNFISKDKNYNKGREIYTGSYEIAKAIDLGDSILKPKTTHQEIVNELKTYTTSQKEGFRIAAIDSIVATIEAGGADAFLRKLLKGDKIKKIIKLVITNNANLNKKSVKFDKFWNNLTNELNIKMTNNAILQGAKTAPILQTAKTMTKDAPSMSFGTESIIKSLLGEVAEKAGLKYRKALGQEIARILTTLDPNDIRILEKQISSGKSWKDIIKTYPNVFGSLLKAPFSPQGVGFTVQEAGNFGYGDMALGELEGQLGYYGILK